MKVHAHSWCAKHVANISCRHVAVEYMFEGLFLFRPILCLTLLCLYLTGKHRKTSKLLLFILLSLSILTCVLMRYAGKSNIDTIRAWFETALIAWVLSAVDATAKRGGGRERASRINKPSIS